MKAFIVAIILCTMQGPQAPVRQDTGAYRTIENMVAPKSYAMPNTRRTGTITRAVPEGWRVTVSGDWAHYIEVNGPGHYCIPKAEYYRLREIEQYERRMEQEARRVAREIENMGKILRR